MPLDVEAHVRASIVPRVLDVIAQRHTAAILRALLVEPRTFDALVHGLGLSRSTLTTRLTHLVAAGCIENDARTYRPTARGRGLVPVLCMMSQWDERPSGFVHACGAPLVLRATCGACGETMRARDTVLPDVPTIPPITTPTRTRTRGLSHEDVDVLDAETLLSDKWTARIVALAFFGVSRFAEMEAQLAIAPNVLAARLTRLVAHGVLARRLYEERPPRSEYVLTKRGHALYALVLAMIDWGDRAHRIGARTEMTHRVCGHALTLVFACEACAQPFSQPT